MWLTEFLDNDTGPKIDPWRSPFDTSSFHDSTSLVTTLQKHFFSKLFAIGIARKEMPIDNPVVREHLIFTWHNTAAVLLCRHTATGTHSPFPIAVWNSTQIKKLAKLLQTLIQNSSSVHRSNKSSFYGT